ncbi:hypothetical protein [Streptomyces somaliensis]|uniref:DUF4235 domain-containing protein n=1 Tax=Streptomyces somaliensis (strain ATCC 33201 / DSM 40738 / JCM 12659 / KCTC 9044 / NCTC 11332 / NRRL B-12077 / IP 733) TaxID=1134445 RepID=A0AA44DH84_STRE0|nr:hypothetical protein [Streptomyces somaliensis]NKY16250.1 hypothetical protein [Streptomyces somaliensis DSM 40738]
MTKRALWQGLVAGAVGGVMTTLGEKVEQGLTGRPGPHVPAGVPEDPTGTAGRSGRQPLPVNPPVNLAVHLGRAAALGVLRSVTARAGLHGPAASARSALVRLTGGSAPENVTGAGAPPRTRPLGEPVADLVHEAFRTFAVRLVADALAPAGGTGPGRRRTAVRPGRRSGVDPLPRGTSHARGR